MTKRFQLLPEWAEQSSVLMAWPHASTDWQPWLQAIDQDYAALATAISQEVPPLILCQDSEHKKHILSLLQGRCDHSPRLVVLPYNDTWCRDYGPITLTDGSEAQRIVLGDWDQQGWYLEWDENGYQLIDFEIESYLANA